jgi:hypothetical protein
MKKESMKSGEEKAQEVECWVPVGHTYNPSYSGGSRFEASLGKYFLRLYLEKNPLQNRTGGLA